MPSRRTPAGGSHDPLPRGSQLTPERELIVVAEPATRMRAGRDGLSSAAGADMTSLADLLESSEATIRPLFGISEDRLREVAGSAAAAGAPEGATVPDLSVYYRVEAPDDRLDRIAAALRKHEAVRAAYIKPPAEPAAYVKTPVSPPRFRVPIETPVPTRTAPINDMLPQAEEAPPATADFSARQVYLDAAPAGIDARFAWTQPGGSGAGVRIIDIEGEWRFTHEDLVQNQGGLAAGAAANDLGWRNHGTAVIGEFGGDRNPFGITGICPDANVRGVSIFGGLGTAAALRQAADLLSPGDIILIELHRPGPNATGSGQEGFIAIEWWPDDYDAIRYAITRGVIVVEAAGNGAENLDDPAYDVPAPGFPAGWSNPFRRGTRDSGAVLVGAGAPPPGTHGRDWGPDRSRLDFSNFGSAVDAQGWGREVTTAGYGDLQGGSDENFWYTDQFSGTSSASPIVVGALGCVQGNLRSRGLTLLTPATARALLRTTGSPQQDAPARPATQRIGNRPDLRQMIGGTGSVVLSLPLHRYWNPYAGDHFYTTDWNELGGGNYGWSYEGVQAYIFPQQVPGSVPLYRYWNGGIADHFYTTNWGELGAGNHGWGYEGVQGYVYTQAGPGNVPLYRYWNPYIGDHFYTTNHGELGSGAYGWMLEGIQCYVRTQAGPPEAATQAVNGARSQERFGPAGLTTPTGAAPPASFSTAAGSTETAAPATFTPARAGTESGQAKESFRVSSADQSRGVTVTVNLGGQK